MFPGLVNGKMGWFEVSELYQNRLSAIYMNLETMAGISGMSEGIEVTQKINSGFDPE